MKYQYQIVGAQQFEYIMGEGDFDSPEAAVEAYKALSEAFKPKKTPQPEQQLENEFRPGITPKELDLIIEKMCLGTTVEGGTELWAKATQAQKDQINCLKRALNRIKSKQGKSNDKYEDKQGYSGQYDD